MRKLDEACARAGVTGGVSLSSLFHRGRTCDSRRTRRPVHQAGGGACRRGTQGVRAASRTVAAVRGLPTTFQKWRSANSALVSCRTHVVESADEMASYDFVSTEKPWRDVLCVADAVRCVVGGRLFGLTPSATALSGTTSPPDWACTASRWRILTVGSTCVSARRVCDVVLHK